MNSEVFFREILKVNAAVIVCSCRSDLMWGRAEQVRCQLLLGVSAQGVTNQEKFVSCFRTHLFAWHGSWSRGSFVWNVRKENTHFLKLMPLTPL